VKISGDGAPEEHRSLLAPRAVVALRLQGSSGTVPRLGKRWLASLLHHNQGLSAIQNKSSPAPHPIGRISNKIAA